MANVTHIYGNEVTDAAARGSLAPAYSASSTYAVGDLVLHEGQLYECSTAISTAEAWTAAHWTAKTVADEVSSLKGGLTEKYTKPSGGIPSTDMTSEVQTSLGKADSAYQKPSGGIPSTDLASGVIPSVPVQDVQIDGTSILSSGVANVPMASTSTKGAVIIDNRNGTGVQILNGKLQISPANASDIKWSWGSYRTIPAERQHESTFYGLAKASGDTSQASSSNAVGTYTDAAKVAIQKMLGVYEAPFRKIAEVTTSNSQAVVSVSTDLNGDPFSLKEIVVYFDLTASSGTGDGMCGVNKSSTFTDGDPALVCQSLFQTSARKTVAHCWISGGSFFGNHTNQGLSNWYSVGALQTSRMASGIISCSAIESILIYSLNNHTFGNESVITIYGR